jgi:hypothetical protein
MDKKKKDMKRTTSRQIIDEAICKKLLKLEQEIEQLKERIKKLER